MEGRLRLNSNRRWEIVDDLDNRSEITSGEVIEVKIQGIWLTTQIESRWNELTKVSEYYAVTYGIQLCDGLLARILKF